LIKKKKILAVITARGGSKGLPRKNILEVSDKPLIVWTIEEAKKSKYIDRLILSSEDAEIIKVAKKWGCDVPFVRPTELAQDDTPGIDPILHAIKMLPGFDYVVLLQPTSPLRKINDIDGCIKFSINKKLNICVSVSEARKSPYWMFSLDKRGRMAPIIKTNKSIFRRQDLPEVYAINGAVYCAKIGWLLKVKSFVTDETVAYVMPAERSLDIDSETDLMLADILLRKRPKSYGS
jgi:N-acylneuraminate cytidylyltransferase